MIVHLSKNDVDQNKQILSRSKNQKVQKASFTSLLQHMSVALSAEHRAVYLD